MKSGWQTTPQTTNAKKDKNKTIPRNWLLFYVIWLESYIRCRWIKSLVNDIKFESTGKYFV